jgi:spore germination cell wall hydrolase CwlJ-like protein
VKQGYYYSWDETIPILHKCQFSFWCDGKPETITDYKAYLWAEEIAWAILEGPLNMVDLTEGSTHYHAHYVKPSWSERFTQTVRINDHIFYRREME